VTSVALLRAQQGARDEADRKSERLYDEADRVNREARKLAQRLRDIARIYEERRVNRRIVE
jgi:hypothetical protein